MSTAVVAFDNFDAGEFGQEAPWKAPKNGFTGRNVVKYVDGSIGPRNGLIEIPTSGLSPTGVILGMGTNNLARVAASARANWFVIGTSVYFMTDAGLISAASGSLAVTPTVPVAAVTKGGVTYLSVLNDKLYKLDHDTQVLTPIATPNSPGLLTLAQYGERTMAGGANGKAPDGSAAPTNRVYYSAASDPENWDATANVESPAGFFDVGDTSIAITAIIPQRTHLVITTSDGGWWVLTGVPGVNHVLRPQLRSVSPIAPEHVAQTGNGLLAYTIASSSDNGSIASIGTFDGSQITLNEKLKYGDGRQSGAYPRYGVVPLKNANDFFITGGPGVAPNHMALRQYEAFTLHDWSVSGVTLYAFVNSETVADKHILTDGGSVGATPRFFKWRAYNNRPAFTSDTGAQPGDASMTPFSATFTTPEWYDEKGREFRVTGVQVDFTSWDTGSTSTNHFDLVLSTLRTWEDGTTRTHTTRTWDQAGASSAATTAGTRHRKRWEFADSKAGNAFTITINDLRGVAIQKITVRLELDETTRF